MSNPNPKPFPVETHWKPGQSPNPGGKPTGTRNGLTTSFLYKLAADFEAHGKNAIIACRIKKPDVYVRAIAALCPREVQVSRPLQDLEDAELLAAVRALESYLAARAIAAGSDEAGQREAVKQLPSLC